MNMTKTTSQILIAVLLLVAPAVLLAQEPPPGPPEHRGPGGFPPMHDPAAFAERHLKMMTQALSLTDEQQKQAATIFSEAATTTSKLQEQMKTGHENLRKAAKEKNAAAIDQAAVIIGNLTAQLISTHEKSKLAFAKILTPEQLAKLDKLESDRSAAHKGPMQEHGPRHRPGAPPPPSQEGPGGSEPQPPGDSLL